MHRKTAPQRNQDGGQDKPPQEDNGAVPPGATAAAGDNRVSTAETLQRNWREWTGSFPDFMRQLDQQRTPYLSHSKVATVERCPRCYYQQYILGEQPSSDALTTGVAFHQAAAAFYEATRAGRRSISLEELCQLLPAHPASSEQPCLDNACQTLLQNAWDGYEVTTVEELFFMDLAPGLPPVIGIIDLVLRANRSYVVVDHKTSKRFNDLDPGQLELYAEQVRRSREVTECAAAFDEYRLVPDLRRVRKPVFRRTPIAVSPAGVPAMIGRYTGAWERIARIQCEDDATPAADCWFCRPRQTRWY